MPWSSEVCVCCHISNLIQGKENGLLGCNGIEILRGQTYSFKKFRLLYWHNLAYVAVVYILTYKIMDIKLVKARKKNCNADYRVSFRICPTSG